jgi:predicted RNA-binding protein with PUA-like domain
MKRALQFWVMKSEPDVFSLAHLQKRPGGVAPWDGVRNYQARNFLRDGMKPGDRALFYHSSCDEVGVAGIMEIAGPARPDDSQFDPKSEFYDAAAKRADPRWWLVDVRYVATFPRFVSLAELRATPALKNMRLLAPGNRLSVLPVSTGEFAVICKLGGLQP